MPINPHEFHVLVPDPYGHTASVVSLADLWNTLADPDFGDYTVADFDNLVLNMAIESSAPDTDLVGRVRKLNETGDSDAYWGT